MNGVHVQRAPGFIDAYEIWFVHDDPMRSGKRHIARFEPQENGPARLEWQEVGEGVASEPTLRLGSAEIEALRRGLDENGPTSQDGLTLARDAIKVRDRLLTLVETLAVASQRSDQPNPSGSLTSSDGPSTISHPPITNQRS